MDLKIPFGLRDGKILHISDIREDEWGLRCRCVCPKCHSVLIARLGKIRTHCFAHQNEDCSYALESALHLFAKQVLEETKYIHLPEVTYCWQEEDHVLYPARALYFDSILVEYRLGNIIPDIILRKGTNELIVEIKVTHGIDDDKFDKIITLDISTLEIDLSSFDTVNFNKSDITKAIIKGLEFKEWVYNSKAAAEEKKQQRLYESEQAKEQAQRVSKKNDKLSRVKHLLDPDNMALLRERWDKDIANNPIWLKVSRDLHINLHDVPEYLNYEIGGELVFNCDRRIWQAILFRVFCNESWQRRSPLVVVKSVISWLKKKPYPLPLNWDLMYLKDLNEYSNYPGLAEVICEFFLLLSRYGFMKPTDRTLHIGGGAYYWWFQRLPRGNSQQQPISEYGITVLSEELVKRGYIRFGLYIINAKTKKVLSK